MSSKKAKHRFTPSEVKQFAFIFDFNDSDQDSLVEADQLGHLLQQIGMELDEQELESKVKEYKASGGYFDLQDLLLLLDTKMKDQRLEQVIHHLVEEDIQFDYFKDCVATIGEQLGKKELSNLLKQIKPDANRNVNMTKIFNILKK